MRTTFSRVSAMTADQRAALTEQFDKAARIATAEPVAVVGIGCRFPGGVLGPQSYWEFLANGGDAISEVPSDRWDADAFYDPDPFAPGRMASKWGGFLPDVAGFDADFLRAKRVLNMTCLHGSFLYIPAGERTKRKETGKRKKENPNVTR